MKLSDYIAKNGDREIDSEKLDEVLQIKRGKVWKPKRRETYWYIYSNGEINTDEWNDDEVDIARWEIGNVFPTKEAVEAYLEYLKTRAALKRYAQEHNDREIDWTDDEEKWGLVYDGENDLIDTYSSIDVNYSGGIYFTSEVIAIGAIIGIGRERLEQYLLYEG